MARTSKPQFTRQLTVAQFEALFPDETACKTYLQARRWPDGVVKCPRCGSGEHVYALKTMPFKWECMACGKSTSYRFSVLAGTIFENTNVALKTWFKIIYLMLTSKKGISALQIQRMFGFGSYRTAHYLCHRVRAGLVDPEFRQLLGIVEVDETLIGGRNKNRYWDKKKPGTGSANKDIVVGAVERRGQIVARGITNTDTQTLDSFVREAVPQRVSLLATDEHSGYRKLTDAYPHAFVRHGRGEYVNGAVHTGTNDGFWSLLKRRIMGSLHKISRKYLPLYVAKFTWRYNNRNNLDTFGAAIALC